MVWKMGWWHGTEVAKKNEDIVIIGNANPASAPNEGKQGGRGTPKVEINIP